jgi:hypothetical protein
MIPPKRKVPRERADANSEGVTQNFRTMVASAYGFVNFTIFIIKLRFLQD